MREPFAVPGSTSWGSGKPRPTRRTPLTAAALAAVLLAAVGITPHALSSTVAPHVGALRVAAMSRAVHIADTPTSAGPAEVFPSDRMEFGTITGRASAADLAGTRYASNAGSGVTVAVIDTGVDPVPALAGQLTQGPDFTGTGTQDNNGHGTFVAGLIAGNGLSTFGNQTGLNGVARGAQILSVKVGNASGSSTVAEVVQALNWVVQNASQYHVGVINLSLDLSDPGVSYNSEPLDAAVEAAWFAGITVVVAAGNTGPGPEISVPANDPYVITAGSVNDANNLNRSSWQPSPFDPTGPTADGIAKPDVLAPGEHVQAPLPGGTTLSLEQLLTGLPAGYGQLSGTSMAAAVVSGEAADLLSQNSSLTPDQVKAALVASELPNGVDVLSAAASDAGNVAPANAGDTPSQALAGLLPALATSLQATWSEATWSEALSNQATWSEATWSEATWSEATWSEATWSENRGGN